MLLKKDGIIIGIIIITALLLLGIATWIPEKREAATDSLPPFGELAAQEESNAHVPQEEDLFLLVGVGSRRYEPILLNQETEFTIHQEEDGKQNTVSITQNSVHMLSSTCDNQNCVQQGVVTAENMERRLLGNMIVCLPNQVVLELVSRDELERSLP